MKKIRILFIVVFVGLTSYQIYFHLSENSNTKIFVDSRIKAHKESAILFINDKAIDTIYFDRHFPYLGKHNLLRGSNKVTIRSIENDSFDYETNLFYLGMYTWNVIEYNRSGNVLEHIYYTKLNLR